MNYPLIRNSIFVALTAVSLAVSLPTALADKRDDVNRFSPKVLLEERLEMLDRVEKSI